jgi:hypothetical protein
VQTNSKQLLAVPVAIGALVFFCAALVVAWHARQHQVLGTQMPNGKGGHMTPGDGYFLALSLLFMAVGWCFGIARLIRDFGFLLITEAYSIVGSLFMLLGLRYAFGKSGIIEKTIARSVRHFFAAVVFLSVAILAAIIFNIHTHT